MKISRRMGVIYSVTMIIEIAICLNFYFILLHGSRKGENLRIVEISQGVIGGFQKEIVSLHNKGDIYADEISAVLSEEDIERREELTKTLALEEKFNEDNINYKIMIDDDINLKYIYDSENMNAENKQIINYILEELKKYTVEGEREYSGTISNKDKCFIVSVNKLNNDSKNRYVILIEDINKEIISKIGESTNSGIRIIPNSSVDKSKLQVSQSKGRKLFIQEEDDKIYSYYEIVDISGKGQFYLKTIQNKEVNDTISKYTSSLVIMITLLAITCWLILYLMIEKNVVKRIVNIINSVNNIVDDKDLDKKLEVDKYGDEIATLTGDINKMFYRLKEANVSLKYSEEKHRSIINSMTNGYVFLEFLNEDIIVRDINKFSCELFGCDEESIINKTLMELYPSYSEFENDLKDFISIADTNGVLKLGEEVNINNKWCLVTFYKLNYNYYFMILNEITEIKKYSEKMTYLANYDSLTKLYNRNKLMHFLKHLIGQGEEFVLCYLDLDNFKKYNDILGHNRGDTILRLVSNNLLSLNNENISVGRLGGDEFVVIHKGNITDEEVENLANNIMDNIKVGYNYSEYGFHLTCSIGIAKYPTDGENINTILKHADIAMYSAKEVGGNTFKIFNPDMLNEFVLEEKLKLGIKKKSFKAFFQPIYNVRTNKIDGAEALIRWITPKGIIMPGTFIQLAKKNGTIIQLDRLVLKQACELCKEWIEQDKGNLTVSVNMSYKSLKHPRFLDSLTYFIDKYNIPAKSIKIEITEDEIIDDIGYITSLLLRLKGIGVKVALDDFGVGYSSFNYIKSLPFDTIKIDRSLLLSIEDDKKTLFIIDTLIKLVHELENDVVCEGVEFKEQFTLLKNLGCDKIQGYYISKAIPKESFNKLADKINKNI